MGGPLIILWINTTLVIYTSHTLFVYVLYSALLKTILCSIENRIKCCTKIHTETMLLFSLLLKHSPQLFLFCDNGLFLNKQAAIYSKPVLFTTVMATIPFTSKISTFADEENRTNYKTDLSAKNTDNEIHVDTSTWSPAGKKKLQQMRKFHQEYQCIFREGASIQTIMKRRISHMNPPCLKPYVRKKCRMLT